MNERIRELFHQAYGYPMDIVGEQAEKFAELIVAECCVALHPMLRDQISRGQGVDLIKKHVGVKE